MDNEISKLEIIIYNTEDGKCKVDVRFEEDAKLTEDGLCGLDSFFYFYIHKCMRSTPSSVKGMAASLKKFYKCMADKSLVDKDNFDIFAADIKESVPIWQEECVHLLHEAVHS